MRLDGSVVIGSDDTTIKIWDVNSGLNFEALTGHTNWIRSLAVLKDGSYDYTIRIWNVNSGQQ